MYTDLTGNYDDQSRVNCVNIESNSRRHDTNNCSNSLITTENDISSIDNKNKAKSNTNTNTKSNTNANNTNDEGKINLKNLWRKIKSTVTEFTNTKNKLKEQEALNKEMVSITIVLLYVVVL